MSFWQKFWKLVSKKDLIFITLIFAAVFVFTMIESTNLVQVQFGEDAVDVISSRYSMNIPYQLIDSAEVVQLPDAGEAVNGRDTMTLRYGTWRNETWGEYSICADLAAPSCIVLRLTDGRIFVFSRQSDATNQELYQQLMDHVN